MCLDRILAPDAAHSFSDLFACQNPRFAGDGAKFRVEGFHWQTRWTGPSEYKSQIAATRTTATEAVAQPRVPSTSTNSRCARLLVLAHHAPFTIGGTRRCYVHPDDPSKCIKVLRPDRTALQRKRAAKGWRRLKPLASFDDQVKERRAYERLISRREELVFRHVPKYFGTVDTDMGIGIVTQLIRDFDGKFPATLEEALLLPATSELTSAVDQFKRWLRDSLLLTRDLLPHNIIVVRRSEGVSRLMIVDGLGSSEFVPLSHWNRFAARKKVERKIAKFEAWTGLG